MSSPADNASKCACSLCHLKRVESGTQEEYERELRVATDRVLQRADEDSTPPLCCYCKKQRAWRGQCVDCYMAHRSQRVFVRGEWRLPDTHSIRQAYWMEEEAYAQQHRLEREQRAAAGSLFGAAAKADAAMAAAAAMPGGETESGFVKNLFETVQGVKYDDKCPHGLPFYACMSCSH